MAFAVAAFGRGTSRAPLSHSRKASQWIAATILKVTSGSAKNARNNAARGQAAAAADEGRGEQGTFAVGLENAQFDALSGRRDAEMIAHRHLDEGRDVKQLFLLLPQAGIADSPGFTGST